MAERLRRGLQNLLDEFDSRTCLQVNMKRLNIGRFSYLIFRAILLILEKLVGKSDCDLQKYAP